ncbi:hypothetical protein CN984_12565 [Bacillus cereus]|uniref:Uncharacterized protein n=1 Tax=Bacillus cereus TaxID=1396 RepID=A0A2A7FNR6_BACCE|nr:hypothetical protein [Bacillus cereus]PEA25907.1 hypothetical protein CON44_18390 [Bacillus cereus]PGO29251.1 hypothetical protein CN984_12565 [Bacillus cereus]
MSKVDSLQASVEKAELKVEKCKGTIERHKKALDKKVQKVIKEVGLDLTGKSKEEIDELREPYRTTDHSWTIYEVIGKLDDIKGATKKLGEAEHVLNNWKEKLSLEIEKNRFLEGDDIPQVIKDFLEQWKQKAYEWHIKRYNDYLELKEELHKKEREARIECINTYKDAYERYLDENGEAKDLSDHTLANVYPRSIMNTFLEERELDWKSIQSRLNSFAGKTILYMASIYDESKRLAWLEKALEQEKKSKMLDLINRINAVTGSIIDAEDLRISEVGNLNGIITGEKANAKVETIGAGGWNIQCFHYRTLVNEIK